MDFAYIASTFLRVGAGLGTTLKLFFITILASLPLGFLITLLLRSGITPLRWLAKVFVYLMRSTPLVLQLLFIYFGLPYLPGVGNYFSTMGRFTATIWGFVLNYAAYFAEIFRGGLLAVEAGQYEAAKVLGLTRWQTITRVVFPQMLRVAMPSISNETITLVKGTSLMFTLAVPEGVQFAKSAVSSTGKTFPFVVAGIIYLVMNLAITWLLKAAEKRFDY